MNRYQTAGTLLTVPAGTFVTNDIIGGLPTCFNLVKIKVTVDTAGGSFDFKIFKNGSFSSLLAFWDNVSPSLFYPADISVIGIPAEALEGRPIPYDDDDDNGRFYFGIRNNDTVEHEYTLTFSYEEVGIFGADGSVTFRSTVSPSTGGGGGSGVTYTEIASAIGFAFEDGNGGTQTLSSVRARTFDLGNGAGRLVAFFNFSTNLVGTNELDCDNFPVGSFFRSCLAETAPAGVGLMETDTGYAPCVYSANGAGFGGFVVKTLDGFTPKSSGGFRMFLDVPFRY